MEVKRFSTWGDFGALTAVFFCATIVASVCIGVVMVAVPDLERGPLLFAAYVMQFSLAIIGGGVWLRHKGGFRLRFGVSWADAPMVLAGMVLVTAAGVVIEPLLNLFPERYFEQLDEMIGRGGWAVLMAVAAAPLLEEIFFRGLILETLSRRWSGRAAVAASAALFGLVHMPILPQMVNAFVIALVMGYIYLATRSLIPVIIIHAINNGLAYMALELTGSQSTDTRELIGNDAIYWIVYAVSVVVLTASLVFIDRRVSTKNNEITLNKKTVDE